MRMLDIYIKTFCNIRRIKKKKAGKAMRTLANILGIIGWISVIVGTLGMALCIVVAIFFKDKFGLSKTEKKALLIMGILVTISGTALAWASYSFVWAM